MPSTIPQPPKRNDPIRAARWPGKRHDRGRDRRRRTRADTTVLGPLGVRPDGLPWPRARRLATLEARDITAWFGDHMVLDQVSLTMAAGEVTALIGPSGCGKSTFLRILNRMHQLVPGAALAGEVLLDGVDIYDPSQRLTQARRDIGMVFQKPNPFPAMSIYDNVLAGLKLTGVKVSRKAKDEVVEECLTKAGLWQEVRERLRQPGGALSGGQQQRLCIARSLAVRPRVLLMDEPCSALDPTSTRVIEETMTELVREVTIVIVTHNMQQAQRVSDQCAFFLAAQGEPGHIVEHGPTDAMFGSPQDPRTADYVRAGSANRPRAARERERSARGAGRCAPGSFALLCGLALSASLERHSPRRSRGMTAAKVEKASATVINAFAKLGVTGHVGRRRRPRPARPGARHPPGHGTKTGVGEEQGHPGHSPARRAKAGLTAWSLVTNGPAAACPARHTVGAWILQRLLHRAG